MFVRKLHTVPRLKYDSIPGLFSKNGFQIAWADHQTDLLEKLSKATIDTDDAVRIPFHILLNNSRRKDTAHVFNYASQAHNNHLFFNSISPSTNTEPSANLSRRIERCFGSKANLFEAIKKAASTVHGNGWVFLVETPNKDLQVLAANNAGTPYHFGRLQQLDLIGSISEDQHALLKRTDDLVAANTKNFNICLLALNLWQHAYVPDFGVSGRDQYIDKWFGSINWQNVSGRLFGESS